jgi:hypothetical protein
MSDKPAWNIADLKPGDEVGIETTWVISARNTPGRVGVSRVVAIHEDSIELESDEFCSLNGRGFVDHQFFSWRLVEPTDEGRIACLVETLRTDLDILADRAHVMPLEQLRAFHVAIRELAVRFGGEL